MFLFYCFCHLVLSHRFSTKPREISLLGSRSHSKASTGCPIEIEQVPQVKAIPKHASDKCEQADKTMLPAAQPGLEPEQHIEQQSAPNLPAHGIGAMAEEIAQVERLFDLAEEGFNGPAAAIQFADRMGRPLQIMVVYKKRMLFCIFSCTNSVRQFILSAWLLKLLIVGTVEVKISLNLARRPTINSATAAMIVVNKAAKTPQ